MRLVEHSKNHSPQQTNATDSVALRGNFSNEDYGGHFVGGTTCLIRTGVYLAFYEYIGGYDVLQETRSDGRWEE
jgi:hypothetical protein